LKPDSRDKSESPAANVSTARCGTGIGLPERPILADLRLGVRVFDLELTLESLL
jgi:hypothetical protein